MRVVDGGSNQLYYLFSDHLGSTSEVRRADGSLHSRQWYKAFGEKRFIDGALPTDRTYTGQRELDSASGLLHYGARIYDPYLNRFVSPDSIVPEKIQGVQAWDRYAYANNNPLRYNDPTGHWINVAAGAVIGGIVGVGLYALNVSSSHQDFDFAQAATVAAVGAASGALISTGVGAVAGIHLFAGIGMATSAGGYLAANSLTGDEFKTSNFVATSAYGFANGALGPLVGTTVKGALALGGITSASSYALTNTINGDPITAEGLFTSTAAGVLSAGIGGQFPRIDNKIFVDNPSRYLFNQGVGSFFKGGLGTILTNLGLDYYEDNNQQISQPIIVPTTSKRRDE